MDIDDLFHSPRSNIARFAEMQVHLYRHDVTLQDYFHALDIEMFAGPRSASDVLTSTNPLLAWTCHAAKKVTGILKAPKFKTDILYAPTLYFGRKTEIRFLTKTLLGLAQTGAEVLCLLAGHAHFREELDRGLEAAGCSKQVTFLDPGMPLNPLEVRTRAMAARMRARAAFEKTVQILEPLGLSPTSSAIPDFERTAQSVEAWERLAPSIEFDAVVARCHWYDVCSNVCRTGVERGKPVITFQQGVVDHTLDVPITASKFVAFGAPSAAVLAQLNRRFFDAVKKPEPIVDFVNAGSLFDVLSPLADQFDLRTVLFVDLHSNPGDPWGNEGEVQALLQLADRLLNAKLPLRRLLIRPHPHWTGLNLEVCLELAREHREVCASYPIRCGRLKTICVVPRWL